MARFTDRQLDLLQAYVDKTDAAFADAGLQFSVESDLAEWAAVMRAAPSIAAVSPSFDPDQSWLTPANSFWVALRDEAGTVVGCICSRLFETDDMMQIIRSYRLFFDRKPVLDLRPLQLVAPDEVPIIAGRVGYTGGYWLHPDWRSRGLSRLLPRINRALALRHFDLDWLFSLGRDTETWARVAREELAMPNRFSCFDGYFPGRGGYGKYAVFYADRGDLLAVIRQDVEADVAIRPHAAAVEGGGASASAELRA